MGSSARDWPPEKRAAARKALADIMRWHFANPPVANDATDEAPAPPAAVPSRRK